MMDGVRCARVKMTGGCGIGRELMEVTVRGFFDEKLPQTGKHGFWIRRSNGVKEFDVFIWAREEVLSKVSDLVEEFLYGHAMGYRGSVLGDDGDLFRKMMVDLSRESFNFETGNELF